MCSQIYFKKNNREISPEFPLKLEQLWKSENILVHEMPRSSYIIRKMVRNFFLPKAHVVQSLCCFLCLSLLHKHWKTAVSVLIQRSELLFRHPCCSQVPTHRHTEVRRMTPQFGKWDHLRSTWTQHWYQHVGIVIVGGLPCWRWHLAWITTGPKRSLTKLLAWLRTLSLAKLFLLEFEKNNPPIILPYPSAEQQNSPTALSSLPSYFLPVPTVFSEKKKKKGAETRYG